MTHVKTNGDGKYPVKINQGLTAELVFGKLPPQALDMEAAVLGAIIQEKDGLAAVIDILKPESFYKDAHAHIFRACLQLFARSEAVDLLTVTEELKKMGKIEETGGPYYLVELTSRVGSSANVEFHARIVAQKAMQRNLISLSNDLIREAFDETSDVFDLVEKAETGIFKVTQGSYQRTVQGPEQSGKKMLSELLAASKRGDGLTGVPSGFTSLDVLSGGWQSPDLIILAARPGMGKTSFALDVAKNAAFEFQKSVAVFSLEMSTTQLVKRMASSHCEIDSETMRTGKLSDAEWQSIHVFQEKFTDSKYFIDDTPGISVFELRAKCRRLKMQHGIDLVIVDYLQLMTGDSGGNREQEISSISRGLKALAKELDIPVIALSQLSRAVETRGGSKRPMLSDLRESGAIEQDADLVSFLYRPEYYGIKEDENGESLKGVAELIIAKHRSGPLDTVRLKFRPRFTKFSDMDDPDFPDSEPNTQFPISLRPADRPDTDNEDLPF